MNVSWMSNPQYLAQVGHTLGGASLILTAALFSSARCSGWGPIAITFAIGLVLASLKEFWFDIVYEKDTWSDSLMDWTFYVLGGLLGWVTVIIANSVALSCAA